MPRPRKPTEMKRLHGNRKATINQHEPMFGGTLDCPDWLPTLAKEEWHRLILEFGHLNLVTPVDQAALSAFVQAYALWRQASNEMLEYGLVVKEPIVSRYTGEISGYRLKKNPAATIMQQERAAMLAAGRLFGFDPSSRSNISAPTGQQPKAQEYDISDFTMPEEDEAEGSVQ